MAKREATTGSEERVDDGNVPAEEKTSHRMSLIEQIAADRAKELDAGTEGSADDGEETRETEDQGQSEQQGAGEDGAGTQGEEAPLGDDGGDGGQESPAAAPDPDPLVTIKIDGVEQQVRQSQLIADAQISAAARQRMNEATQLLARAKEVHDEAIRGRGAASDTGQEPAAGGDLPLPKEKFQEVARALQYEDPEVAAEKLVEFVSALRQPQQGAQNFDANAFQQQVMTQVMNKIEWDRGLEDLGRNYSDILADPYLAQMAGQRANVYLQQELARERQGQRRRPFYDALAQGADEIRQWASSMGMRLGDSTDAPPDQQTAAGANPPVNLSEAREARKAAASGTQPQPRVVSRQRRDPANAAPAPMPTEEERARSAIAEIRKARGQG